MSNHSSGNENTAPCFCAFSILTVVTLAGRTMNLTAAG